MLGATEGWDEEEGEEEEGVDCTTSSNSRTRHLVFERSDFAAAKAFACASNLIFKSSYWA